MSNVANLFGITNLFFSGTNGSLSAVGGQAVVAAPTGLDNVALNSGVSFHRTQVLVTSGQALYTGLATDFLIGCLFHTGTSGVIVLPSTLTNTIIVKDESGTAGISNITISGLPNIEGQASFIINGSGGSIFAYPTPFGWRVY